jgi:tetratricopeptide (TPR) repeat protein
MRSHLFRLTLALATTLAPVAAARSEKLEDPDTEAARRHFERGQELYLAGDYPRALEEFVVARKLRPLVAFEYNIARCYDRMERWEEAIAAYTTFVLRTQSLADAEEARARVRLLRARVRPATTPPREEPPREDPPPRADAPAPPVAAPAAVIAPPPSKPHPLRRRAAAIALGGFSLLSLTTGAGLAGSVEPEYARLEGECTLRPCSAADWSWLKSRADAGNAFLVLGVGAALADAGLWIWLERRR